MSMGNIESYHQIVEEDEEELVKKVVGTKLFNVVKSFG